MPLVNKVANDIVLCPNILLDTINNDPLITSVCEVVTVNDGVNVEMIFSLALTVNEDNALNDILDAWDNSLCDTVTDPTGNEFSGVSIYNDSTPLVGDISVLNFKGSVSAENPMSGQADVYIGSIEVKNTDVVTLSKTDPIFANGTNSAGVLDVIAAKGSDISRMPSIGILEQDLAPGEVGRAIINGELKNVNTSLFNVGDELWISPTGGLVNIKPTGTNNKIQKIAQILKADSVGETGSMLIFGAGRINDIPNIPSSCAWIGDQNDVPQPVPIYSQSEIDNIILNINTGNHIVAYGTILGRYGTSRIPLDNTTPLITEGTKLFSVPITPNSITKKYNISFNVLAAAKSKKMIFALFRDNTCIGTMILEDDGDKDPYTVSMNIIDEPATTSQITYSLRVGTAGSGGRWYINRLKYNYLNKTLDSNGYIIKEFE